MKICVHILLFLSCLSLVGQTNKNCGLDVANDRLFSFDKDAKARYEALTSVVTPTEKQAGSQTQAMSGFTIPVVFHILHKGGAENISDAQVHDALAILNRDFKKMNADTSDIVAEFKNIASDCNIEFRLATIDPNGKCSNGITRHYDNRSNWSINFGDYVYTWNPSKYLNVYVVRSLPSGIAGYTYLPGTPPNSADAIVLLHNFLGSIGTGNVFTSRTLTHEAGHWLNLSHVWGNTNNPGVNCGDDGVADTPITKGHNSCNLANPIDCTPGVVENIQNYMDYSYCSRMFTANQGTRMHNCLSSGVANRQNLSSPSNLMATGVMYPMGDCAPRAEFFVSSNISCVGNPHAFVDQSYNAPISAWHWSSPNASNTSTLQNGILTFTSTGLAEVQLKVGNAFGHDSIIKKTVMVLGAANGSANISSSQGFEMAGFPNGDWLISKPQYGSSFAQTTVAAASGSNSVWINNYFDNPNEPVNLYSPAYNLQNSISGQLSFKYAYARQSANNIDALRVYISTNCGSSWTTIYNITGAMMSTSAGFVNAPFNNPSAAEWRTVNLDILPFSGNTRVYFRIEFVPDPTGPGNNLFIDDINLNSTVGLDELQSAISEIQLYPNPFTRDLVIENRSSEEISSLKVFDISGRLLKEIKPENPNASKLVLRDLIELSPGIYFFEVKNAQAAKMLKVVKQ